MKASQVLVATLVLALSLPPTTAGAATDPVNASPEVAATPTDNVQRILLPRDKQSRATYPTIDKLAREAREKGIPLKAALDKFVKDAIAANPALQGDMPDGPVTQPNVKIDGIPYPELIDLNRYAETKSMPPEEAINRYAWVSSIYEMKEKVDTQFPGELSGAAILDEGRVAQIGFKGKIPEAAIELAKKLPGEVELIGEKGFSDQELREIMESRYRVLAARPEVAALKGKIDRSTGVITFSAQLQEGANASAAKEEVLTRLQPEPSTNPQVKIQVNIEESVSLKPIDNYLRGGGLLNASNSFCTNGFNIISSSGVKGSSTAKHCANSVQYYTYLNHSTYADESTTVSRYFRAAEFDLARYQGGNMTYTRTFFPARNQTRYAVSTGTSPVTNQPVCAFGRTSDVSDGSYRCGVITDSDVCYTQEQDYCGGIYTTINSQGGDSGGPLSYGTKAWGITSGINDPDNNGIGPTMYVAIDRLNDSGGMGSNWNVWVCATC